MYVALFAGSGLVLIIYMKEQGMIANIGTKVGIDADSFRPPSTPS